MSELKEQFRGLNPSAITLLESASIPNAPSGKGRIWVQNDGSTTTLKFNDGTTNYNIGGSGVGINVLDDISDVSVTAPSIYQYLAYDGAVFSNVHLGTAAGTNNVAVGQDALINNTNSQTTAMGVNALKNNTGGHNSAFGYNTLDNNTSGRENSAFGYNAMSAVSNGLDNAAFGTNAMSGSTGSLNSVFGSHAHTGGGSSNCAFGTSCMRSNSSGNSNTAMGTYSMFNHTSGNSNVGIGYEALRIGSSKSNCTGVGYQALRVNTASNNTALGYQSLNLNTTGARNTALGYLSGNTLVSGSDNTLIGDDVDVFDGTHSGCTIIGSGGINSDIDQFVVAVGGANALKTTFDTTDNQLAVEFNNNGSDVFIPLLNTAATTGDAGKNVQYDGSKWVLVTDSATLALNDLTDVVNTTPTVDDHLRYNGTNWVNTPKDTFNRISVAAAGSANPDVSFATTLINTTSIGAAATGVLPDGTIDGKINHFIAEDLTFDGTSLYTNYIMDGSTSTTVLDANGNTINTIKFTNNGNSISMLWSNSTSKWYILNSGVVLN